MLRLRDRWNFIKHPSKPLITPHEVAYWKRMMFKLLKVGMEFEFNLPSENGTCEGNSTTCPCASMNVDTCWQECIHKDACKTSPEAGRCAKVKDCTLESCEECGVYEFACHGIFCTNFTSMCVVCDDFITDCVNCAQKYDPDRSPDNIRQSITSDLKPTQSYGTINSTGVHSIVKDGSLLGNKGAEIITIGRRVDYWEFYNMAKNIIDISVAKGAYINERCSIHMHLLASYFGKIIDLPNSGVPSKISELEKPMPQIIVANFHQLIRRYQNAITWMGMGLDDPNHMTRWEKFRVSTMDISAVLNSMSTVSNLVESNSGDNKYGWINYKYMQFNNENDVTRFHVEFRVLDGMLSPSIIAAFACLYYALMIKAVEISRYGVVEIGDEKWMKQALKVKKHLLNNMKGYQDGDRFGNTSELPRYFDILASESLELVTQLKHILIQVGPAYQILEQLAEKPVALRRCDGDDWEKIEADFAVPMTELGRLELLLDEWIDLRCVIKCKDMDEWILEVGKALREDDDALEGINDTAGLEDRIKDYVNLRKDDGEIIWSGTLGTVVAL